MDNLVLEITGPRDITLKVSLHHRKLQKTSVVAHYLIFMYVVQDLLIDQIWIFEFGKPNNPALSYLSQFYTIARYLHAAPNFSTFT